MKRLVFFFGDGKATGHAGMKTLLGGKGANLAEMTRLGIPVPPGFTISTRACVDFFDKGGVVPKELGPQVDRALRRLERSRGQRLGDDANPLLVSVRSGAKFSMPGMMDTILNLGLNDRTVEGLAATAGDRRFAFDSYRRFVQMYGSVVMEVDKSELEALLARMKDKRGVSSDTELGADDLERLVADLKALVERRAGKPFPQDPQEQLWGAVTAVFRSWNTDRAQFYRRRYGISDDLGTAVNVQSMVFGNLGEGCATGVAFTRDPSTGENYLYGEYLLNAQGEDVVAGIRTPRPISVRQGHDPDLTLERCLPAAWKQLSSVRAKLERHYRDMQDVEFTIERGTLYMLQTRTGKRTGQAALRIAFELHRSRRISSTEVVQRIEPEMIVQLLAPEFDPASLATAHREGRVLARGLPAGPGAASGVVAFTAARAQELASRGASVLLVRNETSPEDIGGMVASDGILTSRGGITSHAAVVARGMGKPCVVGAESVSVSARGKRLRASGRTVREGEPLSIDGSSGEIISGLLTPRPSEIQRVLVERDLDPRRSEIYQRFEKLMRWADGLRKLGIRTNADTPHDAAVALAFGAQGIGLCRTEHMFFAEDRILAVREMIFADDTAGRERALKRLLPMQRKDFLEIFKVMDGLPVTIRLLDPPLHEFLPTHDEQFRELARSMGTTARHLRERAEVLHESNPMLGHRGCRLGLTFPEIYDMQVRAICQAVQRAEARGVNALAEVMIPLVGEAEELRRLRSRVEQIVDEVSQRSGKRLSIPIGTMIEVPRACLVAEQIAEHADFFSFGTNDLTQMSFGFSRDDVGKFLPLYVEQRILAADPFRTVDRPGVGRLMRLAVDEGRRCRPELKLGVCGEHGGDPASIGFFHELGGDYVSCSPFRVPVARLAAAHAAVQTDGSGTH